MKGIEDVDLDVDPEAGDVDKIEYISVDAILDESIDLGLNLPVHIKCAALNFNLVAVKALDIASFKLAYRKAMSKAHCL
ncbi:Hypothetical predicted protein [Octopus vulgaris]|uniref:Uncharacterized protein n=1 Tax=Octopus vulgaris TaxID=6645 RepID=A0AA36AEL1_OCTVU|nr:Hypothetical predicted protein [Octopus vulgaris]